MTTHYLDTEHGYIINREYLRKIFDDYIFSCLIRNNGTLKPLTAEEYNNMWNNYC